MTVAASVVATAPLLRAKSQTINFHNTTALAVVVFFYREKIEKKCFRWDGWSPLQMTTPFQRTWMFPGAGCRTRTNDLIITNELLYQLS